MRTTCLLSTAALAAAVSITACGGRGTPDEIAFNSARCGGTWSLAKPGWHTFELYNGNSVGGEVDLIDPRTGGIYAEVAQFGPGTTTPMRLDVGSGRYAFRCLFEDADPITGPAVTVPGDVKGAAATVPVTYHDLVGPDKQYHAYVQAGLKTLAGQTAALDGDVRRGRPDRGTPRLAHRPSDVRDAGGGV
ncbi:MAG TPA: hypothetical protein VMH35_24230 [Streptosporangiaceae bacterium]|nr:hypothetical protein [Streptosporangiaceae bacterium]